MLGLLRLSYETMHLYTMSRLDRNRCVEVILQYYRIHVPGFPELKSFFCSTGVVRLRNFGSLGEADDSLY